MSRRRNDLRHLRSPHPSSHGPRSQPPLTAPAPAVTPLTAQRNAHGALLTASDGPRIVRSVTLYSQKTRRDVLTISGAGGRLPSGETSSNSLAHTWFDSGLRHVQWKRELLLKEYLPDVILTRLKKTRLWIYTLYDSGWGVGIASFKEIRWEEGAQQRNDRGKRISIFFFFFAVFQADLGMHFTVDAKWSICESTALAELLNLSDEADLSDSFAMLWKKNQLPTKIAALLGNFSRMRASLRVRFIVKLNQRDDLDRR